MLLRRRHWKGGFQALIKGCVERWTETLLEMFVLAVASLALDVLCGTGRMRRVEENDNIPLNRPRPDRGIQETQGFDWKAGFDLMNKIIPQSSTSWFSCVMQKSPLGDETKSLMDKRRCPQRAFPSTDSDQEAAESQWRVGGMKYKALIFYLCACHCQSLTFELCFLASLKGTPTAI